MRMAESSSLARRMRAFRPISIFPETDRNAYEYRVRVKEQEGEVELHFMGLAHGLSFQILDFTSGENPGLFGLRVEGNPYKVEFNLSDHVLAHSAGGPFVPNYPGDFCLHPLTLAAMILPPGKRSRTGCLFIGQDLMRELATELGLPETGPRPRSAPAQHEPWIMKNHIPHVVLQNLAMIEACPLSGNLKRLYVEGKVLESIALLLAQTFAREPLKIPRTPLRPRDVSKVRDAKDLLDERLDDLPSISELARAVGMSATALKTTFRTVLGVPVYQYARNERLRRAQVLLSQGDLSVNEVAETVGYHSLSHFGEAFRKQFGILPSKVWGTREG
jgi:AraC-like DNA-binding protein